MLAFVVLAMSGCDSGKQQSTTSESTTGTSSAAPADAKSEIRMWTFLNPTGTSGREVALKQIISNFEAKNPNIKVVVEPQTWDVMTGKFFAADKAGNAPDVMWVLQDELGSAIKLGTLEPFENLFLKNWTAEEIADVDDGFWKMGVTDGKHYQASLSRNYFGIIYREDLFKEKGIAIPKTWDELIAAGKKLTEVDSKSGLQRYGLGLALSVDKADAQIATGAILAEQGTLFTNDGKANWNNDVVKKAMNLQLDMIRTHKITPQTALTTTPEDLYKDFDAGKYAMIMGAGTRVAKLQAEATFAPESVQMMLLPSFDGSKNSATPISGWSVGVWSKSQHKEAAGKLVEYMINSESDKLWVTVGGQVPVRKSTRNNEAEFLKQSKNKFLEVMADGFDNAGWPQPTEFAISGWRIDLNTVAQDVLANGLTLDSALEKAEKAFNDRNAGK
jgi:multiple sugar transport system substrate-binding protein